VVIGSAVGMSEYVAVEGRGVPRGAGTGRTREDIERAIGASARRRGPQPKLRSSPFIEKEFS
jgi:hypothetical protein